MSNGRRWKPDERATLRRLALRGDSDGEIGAVLGRHRSCVQEKRAEMGIEPGQSPVLRAMMARLHLRRLMTVRRLATSA